VSWVAKTCMTMSRLVANTSHPANNHYNSNLDTIWINLIVYMLYKAQLKLPYLKRVPVKCVYYKAGKVWRANSLSRVVLPIVCVCVSLWSSVRITLYTQNVKVERWEKERKKEGMLGKNMIIISHLLFVTSALAWWLGPLFRERGFIPNFPCPWHTWHS